MRRHCFCSFVLALVWLGAVSSAQELSALERFDQLVVSVEHAPSAQSKAALQRFVDAQQSSLTGLPLVDGRRVRFVWIATSPGPFAVAGSWNGWSAAALPMRRVRGTDLWIAAATLPPAQRHSYKIVEAGSTWHADPRNRKFTYDHNNSVINLEGSGASHLERWPDLVGAGLRYPREAVVYVPAGALFSGQRYPALYLQDGQNVFAPGAMWGGWRAASTLDDEIAAGRMAAIFAVAVANSLDRVAEYTHTPDDPNCSGQPVGGNADSYVAFLALTVKPLIDSTYPTLAERANTAVAGSSLGGLVSLYAAYAHPDTFGAVAALSPTLTWGRYCMNHERMLEVARRAGKLPLRFYLDSGGVGAEQPSADNWWPTREFAIELLQQGYVWQRDVAYRWQPGAPHNEAAWADRLPGALQFLFPPAR